MSETPPRRAAETKLSTLEDRLRERDAKTEPVRPRRADLDSMNPEERAEFEEGWSHTSSAEQNTTSPLDTGDAIDSLPDAETRDYDVKLLSRREIVRKKIYDLGNKSMKLAEKFMVIDANLFDTPKKRLLARANKKAGNKLEQRQARHDELSEQPDSLLNRRRIAKLTPKLEKAKVRHNDVSTRYNKLKETMDTRTKGVEAHEEARRQDYVKELVLKSEAALVRKDLRHKLQEQGASWLERKTMVKNIVENMSKEDRDRVSEVASRAFLSKREADQAQKVERKSLRQETKIDKSIATNQKRVEMLASEAAHADETVEKIANSTIPKAELALESLRTKLSELKEDDPSVAALSVQITEAEHQIAMYKEREIPYWQNVATTNSIRIDQLSEARDTLKQDLSKQRSTTALHADITNQKQQAAREHSSVRDTNIDELLK